MILWQALAVDARQLDLEQVARALAERQDMVAVHYACESFHEAKNHPPGIAAIAVYDFVSGAVSCYSRSDAPGSVADPEAQLLEEFFTDVSSREDTLVLHWNMDRPEFGFEALAKRYRFLLDGKNGADYRLPASTRRFDVDELIESQHGSDYAPHGKLEATAKLNGLDMRSFRDGKTEASLFKEEEWGVLGRSTASKAKIIGLLCERLAIGTLRTAGSAGNVDFAGTRLDAVATVLQIGERYLLVRRSLTKHPHGREPLNFDNEWDDQYVFRALLALFFDDIREEDPVPVTAGAGGRIDFVLADFGLAIELKHARKSATDKGIGEQLAVDVKRYASRSDITHLLCLVFDHDGHIRNPRSLEKDLSKDQSQPGLTVTVKIYDR